MEYRQICRSAVAVCIAATLGIAGGAQAEERIERTFDAEPGERVVIDAERADITVATWDSNTVRIVVEHPEPYETLDFAQDGGTVTATARLPKGSGAGWKQRWRGVPLAHFQVTVPEKHDLALKTSAGDIAVGTLDGAVSAATSGGDVELDSIGGPVQATTSGGDIRANHAAGAVQAKTSGGDIHLGSVAGAVQASTSGGGVRIEEAGGALQAKTSGGSIRIGSVQGVADASTSGGNVRIAAAHGAVRAKTSGGSINAGWVAQPDGASSLRTSGGSINVRLAEELAFTVDARTSGGRVSAQMPVATTGKRKSSRLSGSINGGGPELSLKTSGGSIRLRTLDAQ